MLRSPNDFRDTRVDVHQAEPGPDEDSRPDAEPASTPEAAAPDATEPEANAQATQGRYMTRKVGRALGRKPVPA